MEQGDLATLLIEKGTRWVKEERSRIRQAGRSLYVAERASLDAYLDGFPWLDDVRIEFVPTLRNPPFYDALLPEDRRRMVEFADFDAITFVDTIAARDGLLFTPRKWLPTLLHELVHVAQYSILGVEGFLEEYVRCFVQAGFEYRRILLEEMAYSLQARFDRGERFSIAAEVRIALRVTP